MHIWDIGSKVINDVPKSRFFSGPKDCSFGRPSGLVAGQSTWTAKPLATWKLTENYFAMPSPDVCQCSSAPTGSAGFFSFSQRGSDIEGELIHLYTHLYLIHHGLSLLQCTFCEITMVGTNPKSVWTGPGGNSLPLGSHVALSRPDQ